MLSALLDSIVIFVSALALVRSIGGRFWVGIGAGLARLGLALAAIPILFLSGFAAGDSASRTFVLAWALVSIGGPALSFVTVIIALARGWDAPARDEERKRKPMLAWIAVSLLDVVVLLVTVGVPAALARGGGI
jgi:hypothetical protein